MSNETNTSGGIVCTNCGEVNRHGVFICENCGNQLVQKRTAPQHVIDLFEGLDDKFETVRVHTSQSSFKPGTSVFEKTFTLRLEVDEVSHVLELQVHEGQPILLGRNDSDDGTRTDVDLSQHGGYGKGISRRHATITLMGKRLNIHDMGSSNGTFLNDVRLDANETHQLRDNDMLRLGNMVLWVNFLP